LIAEEAQPMDDFNKYERMLSQGSSPRQIYVAGKIDGLDSLALIRLLRSVCRLSLTDAKEVIVIADELAVSLNDFQEKMAPVVERAMDQSPNETVSRNGGQQQRKKRIID
jgi:hypothetical protein